MEPPPTAHPSPSPEKVVELNKTALKDYAQKAKKDQTMSRLRPVSREKKGVLYTRKINVASAKYSELALMLEALKPWLGEEELPKQDKIVIR